MMPVVLHEAGGVLAIAKPAGLPTQAPPGIASVESLVRERLFGGAFAAAVATGRRHHPGGFLGVPHRLDRAVSGVLLLATTPRAARQLSRQFERRQVRKTYLAVVRPESDAPPAVGTALEWRDHLRKVPDAPRAEVAAADIPDAREAITRGTVAAAAAGTLLLALEPLTGRMHQLRVQAAARGLPVVGDTDYGGRPPDAATTGDPRARPIALHAWRITFRDPETARETSVTCPLPPDPAWDDHRGFGGP